MMIRSPESESDELEITFSIKHCFFALRYHSVSGRTDGVVLPYIISNLYFSTFNERLESGVTANIKTVHSFS